AMESMRIDEALRHALGNKGQGGAFDMLNDLSNKIQATFKISDEDVRKGFKTMIDSGMDAAAAAKSAGLMADLARAKNMSLEQSAKLLGRVYNGNIEELKEMGIFLTSTGSKQQDAINAQAKLQQVFGGAAA